MSALTELIRNPFKLSINVDAFVKSSLCLFSVIPAKAGIQAFQDVMDSRFRGSDCFSTFYEFINVDHRFDVSCTESAYRR